MHDIKSKIKRRHAAEKGVHVPPCVDCSLSAHCAAYGMSCKGYRYYASSEESNYNLDIAKSQVGHNFKQTEV